MNTAALTKKRPRLSKLRRHEALVGVLFASPWLIGFFVLLLYPFLSSLYYSFTNYSMATAHKWLGLANYRVIFTRDTLVGKTVLNTLFYAGISVPLNLVIGFGIALLMNREIKGIRLIRTVFNLPNQISGVAVAFLWQMLLQSNTGIINQVLAIIGIQGPAWLTDPNWQKPSLILMNAWGAGGSMMIYLAALKGVPRTYYEAADIDGASPWKKLIHITIPMVSPTLFYNLITGLIGAMQVFMNAKLMTGSGTNNATTFYVLYLYNTAFTNYRMGYACAMAWLLLLATLLITAATFKLVGSRVYYETGDNNG